MDALKVFYVERTRDGGLLHPSQYVMAAAAKELTIQYNTIQYLFRHIHNIYRWEEKMKKKN